MYKQMPKKYVLLPLVILGVWLLVSIYKTGHFQGTKLLDMEVYQNDQLVLRTIFDAPDNEGPGDLWNRAGLHPFASVEEVARINPDPKDPLQAKLTGAIRIRILHVQSLQTSCEIKELKLVRNMDTDSKWYLPEEEVQRARKAAGL